MSYYHGEHGERGAGIFSRNHERIVATEDTEVLIYLVSTCCVEARYQVNLGAGGNMRNVMRLIKSIPCFLRVYSVSTVLSVVNDFQRRVRPAPANRYQVHPVQNS